MRVSHETIYLTLFIQARGATPANLVGLSRPAIYTLELGQRQPRLDTILELAAGMPVTLFPLSSLSR